MKLTGRGATKGRSLNRTDERRGETTRSGIELMVDSFAYWIFLHVTSLFMGRCMLCNQKLAKLAADN
jgi:hypothetical protein